MLALATVVAGCNGCPPDPGPDGGTVRGKVSFFAPVNNATITSADDADPNTAGIQVEVEIRGDDRVPDGTRVTLTVDSIPSQTFEGTLSSRAVRLTPTIPGGAFPDGRPAALTVAADAMEGETISIKVIENAAATCSFVTPSRGATLRDDSDPAADGFQTDVTVQCSGSSVSQSGPVRLQVFRGTGTTGTPVSTTSVSLSNGRADFQDVTLLEGMVTLQASVASTSGTQVGLAAITVNVDTNRCDAFISAPLPQSVLTTLNTTDLDPATDALDLDFNIQSALCPTGSVVVRIENGATFSGSISGGNGTVRVALPQGTSSVTATVTPSAGTRQPGSSPPASYTVDTLAPCASVTRPINGATLTAADDEENPPNAMNGVTYTLQGAVDHPEGTTSVRVVVLNGAQSVVDTDIPLTNGAFSVPLPDLGAASYVVNVSAEDENGNRCPRAGEPPRQSGFTVSLDAAAVTMSVVNDTQPQNGTLILSEDANTTDAGMQARVRVVLANQDPTNASARVRFQPIDDMGNPAGTPIDREVALASDGTVEVEITLADGRYRLSVVVAFADGRPSVSPAMSATIVVDGTPPDLAIRAPMDGAQLGTAMVDVEVVSMASDLDVASLVLSVNGVPSMATATAGGNGVFTFAGIPLAGSMDGRYQLTVIAEDTAGNVVTESVQVTFDNVPPAASVLGLDRGGATRALGMAAGMRTVLDISNMMGLAELDYDQNSANGLQYGFVVEVPLADCMSLGTDPRAVLDISGIADQQVVTLTTMGMVCRGTANGGGMGLTLQDGDGQATVTVTDAAGNTGSYTFFYTVRRQQNLLRIDSPEDGARVGAGALSVVATSDLASGSCELQVNGTAAGTQMAAPSMTFSNVMLAGGDGTSFTLAVVCTTTTGMASSLPVTIVRDLTAPTGGALVLADGTALPAALNTTLPSQAPSSSMRYLRDLGVEVDAEGGSCARAASATLTVTPMGGMAATYMGSAFTFIPNAGVGRCRSTFDQVDLGARNEAGLTSTISASVTDSAGNMATVGPATVLNDQVPPAIMRVRPMRTFLLASDDTQPATPGLQTVIEYSVTQDGRTTTAGITCTGTGSACPAGTRTVTGTSVIFGEAMGDTVTLSGGMDGSTSVVVTVTDAAGNTASETVNFTFDVTVPALEVLAPNDMAAFNAMLDASGATAGFQVSATVRVRDMDANQTVQVSINGGMATALCTLNMATSSCTSQVTVPQGTVTLTFTATDASGNVATVTRTILVDSVPPVISSIVVLGDVNMNLVGNIAEDGAPGTAGFQTGVRITLTGAEDGQAVSLLTNNPSANTVVATGTVMGGTVTLTGVTLTQGSHLLSARVSDRAGNANDESVGTQSFVVDVAAPSVAITSPSAMKLLAASDGDNNGSTPGYLTTVTVSTDAENGRPCTLQDGMTPLGSASSNGMTATFTMVRIPEGTRALTATCTDAAGNSATSAVYAPLVDTLAPRITMVSPSSGAFGPLNDLDAATPGLQLRFTLTHSNVDVGSTFMFASSLEPMLAVGTHAAEADGTTDVVVTFTQEGMHTITISAVDVNGNSGISAPFTLDIQTGQWNVTITAPATSPFFAGVAQDADMAAAGLQMQVSFTTNAPAGSFAHITVNGVVDAVPQVTTTAAAMGSSGSFTVTLTPGDNTFSVRVDSGAKEGTSSVYQVYVDLTPPAVAITQPSTILRYNRLGDAAHLADTTPADAPVQATIIATVTGCGSVARPGQLDVRVGAASVLMAPIDVTADGPVTVMGVTLPEGANQTLTVRCTDQGVNQGQDTRTITVDGVLPGQNGAALTATVPETATRHRRKGDVNLTFVAPGDDGQVGQLAMGAYELRFIVSPQPTDPGINETNFNMATPLPGFVPTTPAMPGTMETVNVTGMKQEQFVFFGIRYIDDEGNQRVISSGRVDLRLKRMPDLTSTGPGFATTISKLAGDVTGMGGIEDLIVGAPGTVATAPGQVEIFPGTSGATALTRQATLTTGNGTLCGSAVFAVASIDNDTMDDLVVSCAQGHPFVYVWYGRPGGFTDTTPPDLVLNATLPGTNANLGRAATSLDFDGDGFRDLVISARYAAASSLGDPRVFILYGNNTRRTSTVAAPLLLTGHPDVTEITGPTNSTFGFAVAGVRLVDGDMREDLIVGGENFDGAAGADTGAVWVIKGSNTLARGTAITVGSLGTGVSVLEGTAANWLLGGAIATGDYDGDGDIDIAVSGNSGTQAGVRIFRQNAGVFDTPANSVRVLIDQLQNRQELASIDDFNGDGRDDLLLGSENRAYVVLGATALVERLTADYSIDFSTGSPGRATVGKADVNGDGYGDVILGDRRTGGVVRVHY